MKSALAFLGAFHLAAWIFGSLNIIDYHVCIADNGKCQVKIEVLK